MTRRFDAEAHRAEIERLITDGHGCMSLAAALNIMPNTCHQALARLGIPFPDRRARSLSERRRAEDPWLSELPGDLKDARRKMRLCGIPEPEIRRQIDALRARECAR